ncbi:DNA-packaging protein [Chachezhania antarctica]|uniref:DNA-packaging protein n=1 Tax=Chachezhania antarctica TaxID=2340860 RepID=UPI001F098B69|nr:terminase family protein [Chachezhania antarctica]
MASADAAVRGEFLNTLTDDQVAALPYLFEFWALPHQLPPVSANGREDWRAWVILGGRGAGKTRAGAEWVRSMVEGGRPLDRGRARRVALVGETYDQVRDVMIRGDSGILACSPPDRRPEWRASERRLVWPNGAEAQAFSAQDPEAMRGPQFDAAWADELGKWKKAGEAWDQLQFALRLGDRPRVCVTTTPRNVAVLKELIEAPSTVLTHAPSEANRANLADGFLEEVRARFAGSRMARQELDGVLLADVEGALWTGAMIDAAHVEHVPELNRVVVALDPSVSGKAGGDECGIVVVGAVTDGPPQDWQAYVLADCTVQGAGPTGWATAAIAAMERYGAERLVAEVNQGGKLVEEVIRQIDPMVPYKSVHAMRGKAARAEPVAALYEQGRVFHVAGLDTLEDQMVRMTTQGYEGKGSPDRVDALVWALHELMIVPGAVWRRPRIRTL